MTPLSGDKKQVSSRNPQPKRGESGPPKDTNDENYLHPYCRSEIPNDLCVHLAFFNQCESAKQRVNRVLVVLQ